MKLNAPNAIFAGTRAEYEASKLESGRAEVSKPESIGAPILPRKGHWLNNREVEITDLEAGDETMMIMGAGYIDDGSDLTPDELVDLESAYPEYLAEEYFQYQVGRAESAFEGDR